MSTAEIVVAGGGILGASAAPHLWLASGSAGRAPAPFGITIPRSSG